MRRLARSNASVTMPRHLVVAWQHGGGRSRRRQSSLAAPKLGASTDRGAAGHGREGLAGCAGTPGSSRSTRACSKQWSELQRRTTAKRAAELSSAHQWLRQQLEDMKLTRLDRTRGEGVAELTERHTKAVGELSSSRDGRQDRRRWSSGGPRKKTSLMRANAEAPAPTSAPVATRKRRWRSSRHGRERGESVAAWLRAWPWRRQQLGSSAGRRERRGEEGERVARVRPGVARGRSYPPGEAL